MPNRLVNARSPYLRKAADQPMDWYEWGDEAFERAAKEDKPILLSIGGVWCHWCHVMAHESFEDREVAAMINENFVPIKVDRDERPDIDRRYQDVVMRISGSGGWPLTAFLTPAGRVFFGGTYFPPEDRGGRAGMKTILPRLLELYKQNRDRIDRVAEDLYEQATAMAAAPLKSELSVKLIEKAVSALLSSVDFEHGGLGTSPKFFHPSAFEFLLSYNYFAQIDLVKKAIETSLDRMAKGGVYDHLLGGFFRYSTDQKWILPHFEKMLYDNAELLKLYACAYKASDKDLYREVCEGIIRYYLKYGSDEGGGFYASQDADIGVLDEGGYYVFSLEEARSILTEDEFNVLSLYFDIMPAGEMDHDPTKNVLFIDKEPAAIAESLQMPIEKVSALIRAGKDNLLAYREKNREMPYIDKTIYANWNGIMIEAMSVAGKHLNRPECIATAEKAAKRIIADYYKNDRLLHRDGVDGFSEDYLFFAKGLLQLFEVTQDRSYLETAKALADKAIELFWDEKEWGFFDSAGGGPGYLSIASKGIFDSPGSSPNGVAPHVLMLLHMLTRDAKCSEYADKTLQAFASLIGDNPSVSPSYLLSFHAFTKGIYLVETATCFEEALRDFRPYKFVLRKEIPEGVMVCEKDRCRVSDHYVPNL